MWIGGVQHHALNSNKVTNYDFVYPASPGKLFAAPPTRKGMLTTAALLSSYLVPPSALSPRPQTRPRAAGATSLVPKQCSSRLPSIPLSVLKTSC
jgi:hypothetical protein